MFDLIKKLAQSFGVSGNEEEVREVIINEIKVKVDELKIDALGNLIAIKKGNGKKIMVAAHMDENGIMVTHINEKGFLRFSVVGWLYQFNLLSQRIKFKNGVTGVISSEEKLEDIKKLKIANLYIDIGAKNKEAEEKVRIGDVAALIGETVRENNMIISKALDDRCGCAVLVQAIKNLPDTENELYFVFTVQEELGLRGAKTASFQLFPDIAIAVDVTLTGDTPECKLMEVRCGDGPAIKVKDSSIVCHQDVKKLLADSANILNMPYQYEILESGGNDSGAIHVSSGGIPSGAISIPCRYVHTSAEAVDLNDVEKAVKLLIQAIIV
jgi:endoglucanase